MKNATITGLVCAGLVCVLLLFFWQRDEESTTTRAAPESAPRGGASTPEVLRAPRSESDEREIVEALAMEEGKEEPAKQALEREQGVGVLRGHVVDGSEKRLATGRVQVFRSPNDLEPIAQADVGGAECEYRFSLSAGNAHYVAVDPESVESLGVPPLSRGFTRAQRGLDGSILLNQYSRVRVEVQEGETSWQDLRIARLGDVVGRLLGEEGMPLPGIVARVVGLETNNSGNTQDDTTDENGSFRHHQLFPGSYRLSFFSPVVSEDFQPPLPTDFVLMDGESRDLGDFRAQSGTCTVVGIIVDQDGRPFPGLPIAFYPGSSGEDQKNPYGLGDVTRRTKTGPDGAFELSGLPAIPCKISLTPDYEPGRIVEGQPAFWEQPVEVFLSRRQPMTDIGVHVVQQSRPFRLQGRLLEKAPGSHRGLLRATVSQVGPLPEGVRRSSLQRVPVELDWESGTFECLVETPRPQIELRFELKGHEDRVLLVQPEPWGVWTHDITIPDDFKEHD
jgi:hypothetical protein